ncbi:MAG: peptidylprolyl isomerase [Azospirillaceae bacterium]|nr:peptidylprolyl isomerase [Azospirillaceae bacterium]
MLSRVLRVAALTAVLGAVGTSAWAQQPAADNDPVVARVNGQEIRRSAVTSAITQLPAQVQQMPMQMIYPHVLDQLVSSALITKVAYAQKLQDDPEVKERLKQQEERIVQQVYLLRQVNAQITDAKLQDAYKKYLADHPVQDEVKASHILVDSEDKAKDIIKKLAGGADFAALAKESSSDTVAAAQGGDLGFFSKDQMVEPFSNAAFAMKVGEISKDPVKSQFGWHVIKVTDRRKSTQPPFDQVAPELKSELQQQIVGEIVDNLRKDAKIEKFQIDGSPEPAADAAKTPTP